MFAMKPSTSTCVHSWGYDPTQQVLAVVLRDRGGEPANVVRNYRDVPANIAAGFEDGRSVGKHWAYSVHGKFDVDVVAA